MLKKQGIEVVGSSNFTPFSAATLVTSFYKASETAKKIANIFNKLAKNKKVIIIVTKPNGSTAHIDMTNVPHEEQIELINHAFAVIVTDKAERPDDHN